MASKLATMRRDATRIQHPRAWIPWAVCVPLLFTGCPGERDMPQVSPEARAALMYFLKVDCRVEERKRSLADVERFKDILEPIVLKLAKDGPNKELQEQINHAVEEEWELRQEFLKDDAASRVPAEDLAILQKTDRAAYTKQRRAEIAFKYNSRAVKALYAFNSPRAVKALDEIGEQDKDLKAVIDAMRKSAPAPPTGVRVQ